MHTFKISYRVTLEDEEDIDSKVEGVCLEQSVELPRSILSQEIETNIVGQVSKTQQISETEYDVEISWPVENTGGEISQFLNILYGNISLQPGIRVTHVEWDKIEGVLFKGPAFGITGLRKTLSVTGRALSATALKPLGSNADELGELCYTFASAGVDIIKDDHGLANQSHAPFVDRVQACVAGIRKAAGETGVRSVYYPNITALATDAVLRYEQAAELGADGVLICPHIAGMETMHQLARMELELPVIAHPAFSGSLTTHRKQGLTPDLLYGQLWRALGADCVIYPNANGRFSFTAEECRAINESARSKKLPFKPSFPMPGGGIKVEAIPQWLETYGKDTVFLLGGSLYEHPGGVKAAARELVEALNH